VIEGPIAWAAPALAFDELAQLRDQSRTIAGPAVSALDAYRDAVSGGYFHVLPRDAKGHSNRAGHPSRASTATVVPFLIRSGRWARMPPLETGAARAQTLLNHVVVDGRWTSAGLPANNPFTVAFLLELVASLCSAGARLSDHQAGICKAKLEVLLRALRRGKGRISIANEVANSYLTELVARVLALYAPGNIVPGAPAIPASLELLMWQAAINSINAELALLAADSQSADSFELGYAVLLVAQFPGDRTRPEHRALLRRGLAAFFDAQRADGSWPRSRRLFRYPDYGDAYCYEFEFLARLLRVLAARTAHRVTALVPFLPNLQRSITRLGRESVELPNGTYGWPSGHHRAFVYPESWSTAACFDVCDLADRYATDTITSTILRHLELPPDLGGAPDAKRFTEALDADVVQTDGRSTSLKDTLERRLLVPARAQIQNLEQGLEFDESVSFSAILYGPPGTSKTEYARAIAEYLGWTLLTVDPSHVLRAGVDSIHAEINALFRMLAKAERVVIFFDEIDELVRDRGTGSAEAVSRFLTTSMLPRIIKLRTPKKRIYLIATNHIEVFDAAVARPGRFDLVLPVMPPTAAEKLRHWPALDETIRTLGIAPDEVAAGLTVLTFDEMRSELPKLQGADSKELFMSRLQDAAERSTLRQTAFRRHNADGRDEDVSWEQLMAESRSRIRGV
jgi:ATPase family associated with various cellular activities (AAA)